MVLRDVDAAHVFAKREKTPGRGSIHHARVQDSHNVVRILNAGVLNAAPTTLV